MRVVMAARVPLTPGVSVAVCVLVQGNILLVAVLPTPTAARTPLDKGQFRLHDAVEQAHGQGEQHSNSGDHQGDQPG